MIKGPTYDDDHVKLTEGTLEVFAFAAVDLRPEGDYPIDDAYDVLMSELEDWFRCNNERAVLEICNFTALPGETTSHRHSRLARFKAENPTVMTQEMAVRLFMESYPALQQKAN